MITPDYCKYCLFFKQDEDSIDTEGRCHRFPPNVSFGFPKVTQEEWCGEYDTVEYEK